MIIREAHAGDVPELSAMGLRFYRAGKFSEKKLDFNTQSLCEFLFFLITAEVGLLLVAEKDGKIIGSIAGIIAPWMLSFQQSTITETWWWVDPEYRTTMAGVKLLREFENKARGLGVSFCMMGTHDVYTEDKLQRFYRKLKYKHLEHKYIKEL